GGGGAVGGGGGGRAGRKRGRRRAGERGRGDDEGSAALAAGGRVVARPVRPEGGRRGVVSRRVARAPGRGGGACVPLVRLRGVVGGLRLRMVPRFQGRRGGLRGARAENGTCLSHVTFPAGGCVRPGASDLWRWPGFVRRAAERAAGGRHVQCQRSLCFVLVIQLRTLSPPSRGGAARKHCPIIRRVAGVGETAVSDRKAHV